MLEFTSKELYKIQILQQGIDPNNFDSKGLPSDTHVVKYKVNNSIMYDAVRGYTKADIFDTYYDKVKPLNGEILDIRSGYGSIRPNLYGKIKTGATEE